MRERMTMKKYLQACEMGGSIYGKKRITARKDARAGMTHDKNDLLSSFSNFYKKQSITMGRVFRRDK